MSNALRIIFAGTPDFAAQALQSLLTAGHQLCAVYTQPDRPAGRGRKLTSSAVKLLAIQQQIPVFQPRSLRDDGELQTLQTFQADIMVVVAYGLILPPAVLSLPRLGCINIHASLLPRWRGAAPIQRAIQAGDRDTGITIIQMDKGLDTGAMLRRRSLAIAADETGGSLHDRLAVLGGELVVETLAALCLGGVSAETQDNTQSCYAAKLDKVEARLDWNLSALTLERQCRAFNPWPICFTELADGRRLRVWAAQAVAADDMVIQMPAGTCQPGTVLAINAQGIDVVTATGLLRLLQLQLPGGRSQAVRDFVNNGVITQGAVLGCVNGQSDMTSRRQDV